MAITKGMSIEEIMQQYPGSVKVFHQFQMGCISCHGAAAESLEKGALMHGVNVDEILSALNSFVDQK